MSAGWKNINRRYWHDHIRPQAMRRNQITHGGKCELAIEGVCTGRAEQVHHVLGVSVSPYDLRYLQAVCRACNNKIGDPQKYKDPPSKPLPHWS